MISSGVVIVCGNYRNWHFYTVFLVLITGRLSATCQKSHNSLADGFHWRHSISTAMTKTCVDTYLCIWVPDVGSSHCQRWWLCQQTAGWGPNLLPWCWAGIQSTQRPGHWKSSAACHGPLPWSFLLEGGKIIRLKILKLFKRMASVHRFTSRQWAHSHSSLGWWQTANVGLAQRCLTIQTQVLEVTVGKVVLHDGHEWGHLTEEQHFVVGGPQLGQDTIQQLKLPRGAVQVRAGRADGANKRRKESVCTVYPHPPRAHMSSPKAHDFKLYVPAHDSTRITKMLGERLLENTQTENGHIPFCPHSPSVFPLLVHLAERY